MTEKDTVPIDPKEPYIQWHTRTLPEEVERLKRVHNHNALELTTIMQKVENMARELEDLESRVRWLETHAPVKEDQK